MKHYPNVFLNTGHGSKGTSTALATSKIVSELIETGRPSAFTQVEMEQFSPKRFGI